MRCMCYGCKYNSIHDGYAVKGRCTLDDVEIQADATCANYERINY